jgi:ribosomal protein S18 acetylase RimI-like enzyme
MVGVLEMNFNVNIPDYDYILQAIDENRTPMGFLFLKINKDDCFLLGMIRHPEFKGLGVTKALHDKALEVCNEKEIKNIYAGVLKTRTGGIKLLKQYGFKEVECKSDKHRRFKLEL